MFYCYYYYFIVQHLVSCVNGLSNQDFFLNDTLGNSVMRRNAESRFLCFRVTYIKIENKAAAILVYHFGNMACDPSFNEFDVERKLKEIDKNRTLILLEYAEKLKKRYVEKISEVGVDPVLIPTISWVKNVCHQLKQVTCCYIWFWILAIIRTNSLKLQAYSQMVSGSSIVFKELFFRRSVLLLPVIEFWTRVNGKLSCTQVKCTWILPTYVKEVNYSRIADINFSSARKLNRSFTKPFGTPKGGVRPERPYYLTNCCPHELDIL